MLVSKSIRALIVITAFTVLSGATFCARSVQALDAKDKDNKEGDDEAQAAKDLAEREKKLAEEKAKKAAEAEAAAAAEAKKKEDLANKNKPPAKVAPPVAPQRCPLCQDMKIMPNLPYRNYIKFENEPPPNPDYLPAWRICDKCQKGVDVKAETKAISDDMKARQDKSKGGTAQLEQLLAKKFVQFETPYVVVRSMLPAANNHKIANGLEKCAGILQTNSKSMVLMTTRPDMDQILFFLDQASYDKFIDSLNNDPKGKAMMKKAGGCHLGPSKENATPESLNTGVSNSGKPGPPHENQAVYNWGHLIMDRSTNFKAKPWLVEGFAAYCENATFNMNTMITFSYDENDGIKFEKNWNDFAKKMLAQNKIKLWEELFEMPLEHLKMLEYMHFYSMVSFLVKADPVRFDKFVLLVKEGMDSAPALELAYGKSIRDIQLAWRQWIPTQK